MSTLGEDDDTTTPIDLDARRPEVPLGRAWIGLERTAQRNLDRIREARVEWGEATPERQAALALAIAEALREHADDGHELAHNLEDFARRSGA